MTKHIKKNGRYISTENYSELEENQYVIKWLKNVKSRKARLSLLKRFCDFLDKDIDTILLDHQSDRTQPKPADIKNIVNDQLRSFFGYLTGTEEKKFNNILNDKVIESNNIVSWNSARQYVYSKLTSFFARNNVPVKFQKGDIPPKRKEVRDKDWRNSENDKLIKLKNQKESLKNIRDTLGNVRDRSSFLCMISSSMDAVDLFKLKIDDYKKGFDDEYNVSYIEGIRQKIESKEIRFRTFFNSEACEMIELYFKEREKREGELLKENDHWIFSSSKQDWLFTSNKKDKNGKYPKLKETQFADNFKKACELLNLKNVTPKSLRRWFKSHMTNCGVSKFFIKVMMGHQLDVTDGYDTSIESKEEFVEKYVKEFEQYTLLGNGTRKITAVEEEIIKLKEQIKNIDDKFKEMKEINEKLMEIIKKQEKSKN